MVPNHFVGGSAFVEKPLLVGFAEVDDLLVKLVPNFSRVVFRSVEE